MVRIGQSCLTFFCFLVKNRLKWYYRNGFLGFGLFPFKSTLDLTAKKIFKTEIIVKK